MPGTTTDTVPAMLTPGEFVVKRESAKMLGMPFLEQLNAVSDNSAHSEIDALLGQAQLANMKPMYGGGKVVPGYENGGNVPKGILNMPFSLLANILNKPVPRTSTVLSPEEQILMELESGTHFPKTDVPSPEEEILSELINVAKQKEQDRPIASPFKGYENGGNVPMTPASADFYDKGYILPETDMGGESVAPYEAGVMPGDPMTNWLSSGLIDPEDLDEPKMNAPDILKMIQENNKSMDGLDKKQKMLDRASVLGLLGLLYKANKNNAVFKGMQEGGMIDYQNGGGVSDSLYWANHPANNPEMNGGSIGTVREQVMSLQDSMKVDTVNKAKKAFELLKLKGLLNEAESIEYQNPPRRMNPSTIPNPNEASQIRNLIKSLSI